MSYLYWTLRYVPNVARGEFTNIGILCGRDGQDWALRFDTQSVGNRGQLGKDLGELRPWINWFKRRVGRDTSFDIEGVTVSEAWVAHLRARQSNAIQFSEAKPVAAPSAEAAINILFPHLVEREVVSRRRSVNRVKMRAEVSDTLRDEFDLVANRDFFVKPKATIGKQRSVFDFLRPQAGAGSLTNVWAFNVSDVESLEQQVQASNYFLTRLRDKGANLQLPQDRALAVLSDAHVGVIYDPPTLQRESNWRSDVFEGAKEAWALNGVTTISLEQFRSASELAELAPAGFA